MRVGAALARLSEILSARAPVLAEVDGDPRRAAVAIVIRPGDDDDPEVLFIKRAVYAGDPWSGHVAFPGGRKEPQDGSLEATAIRETREETGIDIAGAVLGALDEVRPRIPVLPSIVIRPFVAVVAPHVTVSESGEVDYAFWVPLSTLRDPATSGEATVVVRGEERQVSSFRHGEHVIWGLTERILRQLLDCLD